MPANSEVRAWIRTQLQEASANRWTDVELLREWDNAQKDFSMRTELLETQVSITSGAGDQNYGMSKFVRFLKMRKLVYNSGTTQAIPLKWYDYQDYPWPQVTQTNQPYGYSIYDDKIYLLFTPNAVVSMNGLYVFSCSNIRDTIAFSANSEVSDLPERYHLKAAEMAVGNLLMKYDETIQRAQVHLGLYEKFVKETLGLQRRSGDDTRQAYFKTYASPGFSQMGEFGSGYTGRPLSTP